MNGMIFRKTICEVADGFLRKKVKTASRYITEKIYD